MCRLIHQSYGVIFPSLRRSCYLLISKDDVAKLRSFVLGPDEGESNSSFGIDFFGSVVSVSDS